MLCYQFLLLVDWSEFYFCSGHVTLFWYRVWRRSCFASNTRRRLPVLSEGSIPSFSVYPLTPVSSPSHQRFLFFLFFFLRNCVASKRWERWERSKGHVRLARARIAENKCDSFTLKGLPWRHARRNGWLNYLHFILTSRFADTWCSV